MPYQDTPDTHTDKETTLQSEVAEIVQDFAHPYGIVWEYEPRTFPLEWDEEGNVTEAFSPDFYLPNQDLYIELTTLRPKLTTIKNRKVRRMGRLYPEINVKLFKRRDIRDLMIKFGLDDQASEIAGTDSQNDSA